MVAIGGPRIVHHWTHAGRRTCDPWGGTGPIGIDHSRKLVGTIQPVESDKENGSSCHKLPSSGRLMGIAGCQKVVRFRAVRD